jgi:hypothetical protein
MGHTNWIRIHFIYGPRHDFMLIAMPNLDGSFTCTLFMPFEGENSFESLKDKEPLKLFLQHISVYCRSDS